MRMMSCHNGLFASFCDENIITLTGECFSGVTLETCCLCVDILRFYGSGRVSTGSSDTKDRFKMQVISFFQT